jgi:hypothetical protein
MKGLVRLFRQSIIPTVTLLVMSMGLFCGAEAKTIEAGHATVSWKGKGVIDDLGDGDRVFSGTLTGTILVKHLPEGSEPAQIHGVNPFVETPELAHSCWPNVLSHPPHPLRVRVFCWLKKLYGCGAGWIDGCHRVLELLRRAVAQR